MRLLQTPVVAAAALALWLGTGCEKKPEEPAKPSTTAQGQTKTDAAPAAADAAAAVAQAATMLDFVPADSPYVFASLEPMPQALADKIFEALAPMLAQADAEIDKALAQPAESTEDKVLQGILKEFKGNLNKAGFEKLGFSMTPRFALYGVGLLPALRIELKDPEALKAAIARVEASAGATAPVEKLGEQAFWKFTEDKVTFVIAIVGNDLIAGITPATMADKNIPLILGQAKPANPMSADNKLAKVQADYGFKPFAIGFVDTVGIAKTVLGDGQGLNAEVWTALGAQMPPLSPVCKTEILDMVAGAPSMAFGYTEMTADLWAAQYVIALEPALATALAGLSGPVPGLGGPESEAGLLSFGVGLDVQKGIDFVKAKLAEKVAKPYQCELLTELNTGITEANTNIAAAPIPPFVSAIKGFNVVVKAGEFEGGQPKNVKATALVAMDNPSQLLAMAKGMNPALATFEVPTDGKPVAFPEGIVPPGLVDAPHVAMNDKALAISVGAGEQDGLSALLTQAAVPNQPIIGVTYDAKKVMEMLSKQMEASLAFLPPEAQAQQKAEMEMTKAIIGVFGKLTYNVRFTDKGIVLDQKMRLN